MEDTSISIIGIFIASILMFVVPFFLLADRNDDVSQLIAQTATASFVDNVLKTGRITVDEYQKLVDDLNNSGVVFEVDLEVKILDKNVSQLYTTTNSSIGNNEYYSLYTSQIEEKLYNSSGTKKVVLKEGDRISVTVKNSGKTLSQTLKNLYYTVTGEELHIIVATGSGMVAVNGAS